MEGFESTPGRLKTGPVAEASALLQSQLISRADYRRNVFLDAHPHSGNVLLIDEGRGAQLDYASVEKSEEPTKR